MNRDPISEGLARYQIVVTLATRLPSVLDRLGKTATQKSIFLLQELYGLEAIYDFEFYNFGVFSKDIAFDLDSAQTMGLVDIKPDAGGYGVEIVASIQPDNPIFQNIDSAVNLDSALSEFSKDYAHASLSRLELDSTVVYVDRDVHFRAHHIDLNSLISRTLELKPKFTASEATEAITRLKSKLKALQD